MQERYAVAPRSWLGYAQLMVNYFAYAAPVAMFLVFATLCVGIFALFRGGEFGRSWSNRMMRLRVVAQFVAVAILMAALWWSQNMMGQPSG
jgi:hypothetical protein